MSDGAGGDNAVVLAVDGDKHGAVAVVLDIEVEIAAVLFQTVVGTDELAANVGALTEFQIGRGGFGACAQRGGRLCSTSGEKRNGSNKSKNEGDDAVHGREVLLPVLCFAWVLTYQTEILTFSDEISGNGIGIIPLGDLVVNINVSAVHDRDALHGTFHANIQNVR